MTAPGCFTVIGSLSPARVGKRYSVGDDGKLVKSSVASITKGRAITVAATAENLVDALRQATKSDNLVLVLDSFSGATPGTPAAIEVVTEVDLQRLIGGKISAQNGQGFFAIKSGFAAARLKRLMRSSGWILIDADNPPGMPAHFAELTLAERLTQFEPVVPGISRCRRIEYLGSSARVVNGSGAPTPAATHAIVEISDPAKLTLLRDHVRIESVRHDLSFWSERHSRTEPDTVVGRTQLTLIDWSVWLLGRLIFNAKPNVARAPGYRVLDAGVRIVNPDGGVLDIGWIKPPAAAALKQFRAKTGLDIRLSTTLDGGLAVCETGALKLSTAIESRLTVKPLADWLVDMLDNDISQLRCETPFRASTSEAAFIRIPERGEVFVHDSGMATNFYLDPRLDEEAAAKTIDVTVRAMMMTVLAARARQIQRQAPAWPERKPIVAELKPVPVFDADVLLPDALRPWVMDEAERMACPPDFIAAPTAVSLGSLIGAHCAIKPKAYDSWLVMVNLWGANVGPPGALKSPAWEAASRPMGPLIAQAQRQYEAELREYDADKAVFAAQSEGLQSRIRDAAKKSDRGDAPAMAREFKAFCDQAPKEPTLRRYKTNDPTVASLGELLRDNEAGILAEQDELVGLVSAWDRKGCEGDREFFLMAWNGNQSFDVDRIGRGHIPIKNLCVSIFGGIQPDKLIMYLKQAVLSLANDGMLQRFQVMVYPDPWTWEYRDRTPNWAARDKVFAIFKTLAEFDPLSLGAQPADDRFKFPHFSFSPEAQRVYIAWSKDLHQVRIPKERDLIICQHLVKYDKLFPALSLIFHLVDCAARGVGGPVTEEAARRAGAWCEYLEAHARRCYGLLQDDGLRAAQTLAKKLEDGALRDSFTARDVIRHQWRNLKTDDAIQAALDWLKDDGWIRGEATGGTGPGSGRRTIRYRVHPDLTSNPQEHDA